LPSYFSPAPIIWANIPLSFAYVEFNNVDDARAAIDNLNLQVFEGRSLVVQFHKAKARNPRTDSPGAPTKTIFIGNMSFEMSDKDLNDMFKDIQNVIDVRVAIDRRTGAPRGFAHADFVDVASAQKAKEILDGKVFHGRSLRIDFSTSASNNSGDRRAPRNDRNDRRDRRDRE
jgi:RNA recognition motif-containing protein